MDQQRCDLGLPEMRWAHNWKVDEDTGETKARARLVVKGFTDPDLTEILSRLSRQLILQISASHGFRLRMGDVKTAFLSGDREEARRDVYAGPPRDARQITDHTRTSVEFGNCSVRSPERAKSLVERVVRDLTETGGVQHQLDQCTFMFMNGTELVGLIGVYVDDFLVDGCDDDTVFSAALSKLKGAFHGGTWNEDNFTVTGIEIETLQDGGFHLRQQKFVDQLELVSLSQRRSRAQVNSG